MSGLRRALIIANDDYEHQGLGRLLAPSADAEALSSVLGDEQIGDFAVEVVRNEPAHIISEHIEELFSEAHSADVLLLHLSCHGLKSESGELFFAAVNTRPDRLGSTAVSADFVQRCMRTSRARSVVLLLDCCYGGAFAQGVVVRAAGDINVLGSFPHERLPSGRGRAVITASSAMEYAFEGDQLAGDTQPRPSVFTSALVQGLATGEADRDQDGWVSLDELYDYVFDKVREQNPHQTPSRDVEMQGELLIARRGRPVTTPPPLPPELVQAIDHPMAGIRAGAVQELARVLRSGHAGLALAARLALADLTQDDSRSVSAAARAVLETGPPAGVPERPAEPSGPVAGAGEQPASPPAAPVLPEQAGEPPVTAAEAAGLAPSGPSTIAATLPHGSRWLTVHVVAFSLNGRLLASGSQDAKIQLWDPATGEQLRTLTPQATIWSGETTGPIYSVVFSSVGLFASAGADKAVRLWDPATGQHLRVLVGHTRGVWGVAFSPDGCLLASAGDDRTVRLWDPATGQQQLSLTGHTSRVRSVAFSPDGCLLASAGDDRTVRLWDPATGQQQLSLTGHTNWVRSVAFSPDGRLLASAGDDGTVCLWR